MKNKFDLNNLPAPQDKNILGREKIVRKAKSKSVVFRFSLSDKELKQAEDYVEKNDFDDISELVRFVLKQNGVT